jgi:hypothetical protein
VQPERLSKLAPSLVFPAEKSALTPARQWAEVLVSLMVQVLAEEDKTNHGEARCSA